MILATVAYAAERSPGCRDPPGPRDALPKEAPLVPHGHLVDLVATTRQRLEQANTGMLGAQKADDKPVVLWVFPLLGPVLPLQRFRLETG